MCGLSPPNTESKLRPNSECRPKAAALLPNSSIQWLLQRLRVACTAANQLVFSEKFLHMEQGPSMSASVVGISGPALFCQRKRKPHSRLLTPSSQVRPDGPWRHSAHAEPKTHLDPVLGEHVSLWGCRGSTRSQPGSSRPQPRGSRTCLCPLLTHGNQEPPRQARTEGGSSLHSLGGCLGHTCKHITTHNTHTKHL